MRQTIAPAGQALGLDPSLLRVAGDAAGRALGAQLAADPALQAALAREAAAQLAHELKPAVYVVTGSVLLMAVLALVRAVRER